MDLNNVEPYKISKMITDHPSFEPNIGADLYWDKAKEFVEKFYSDEINRISSVKLEDVSSGFFFTEYVWVVHATGFSAKAVGKFMPRLIEAYGSIEKLANESYNTTYERVKLVCNNPQKIRAIHKMARIIFDEIYLVGWEKYRNSIASPGKLAELPYIGKITCYHLGRNIGLLDCVKPDLHLVRMAEEWNYESCLKMCQHFADKSGLKLGIVDYILWMAASTFGTISIKKDGHR